MRIPAKLLRAAHEAHRAGSEWSEFQREHAEAIRRAEPFDRLRYHRLSGALLHVVCCGELSGQFAAGDPDAISEPWEADNEREQPADVGTSARFSPRAAGLEPRR